MKGNSRNWSSAQAAFQRALKPVIVTAITYWAMTHSPMTQSATAQSPPLSLESIQSLEVIPKLVQLNSPESSDQILVFAQGSDGSIHDVTRLAKYELLGPAIVDISPLARVLPMQDGQAEIRITLGGLSTNAQVRVSGIADPPPISFADQIIPILSKAGCNSGGCHGKAEGQNGFKLSVFGYDPQADHQALVMQGRGRRISMASPEKSLFVRKATSLVPHGGGRRIEPDSRWDRLIRRWIKEGAHRSPEATGVQADHPRPPASPPEATAATANSPATGGENNPRILVQPAEIVLESQGTQQLRVTFQDAFGQTLGVTGEAEFQSNQDVIAGVDRDGLITATDVPGEAAILVRYLGHVTICRVTRPRDAVDFVRPAERNFIDKLVWDKLARLRVAPSTMADDATFLRRVYLDTIGTLPTSEEARRFLADPSPEKHGQLIQTLLDRPEYADYWSQRWSDLLQIDKDLISPQSAVAITRWIRRELARNTPYDEFARSILTARGPISGESPAAFYQVHADAEKASKAVSQLFLGVRIECAKCHHHPFERWDQRDYFAMAGFFTGIERRVNPQGQFKIVPVEGTDLTHPRTNERVPAAGLGAQAASFNKGQDRRQVLADWVTAPDNPYFARAIANRIWAHYFGRGLVEPVDDLRATNPASNESLLDALAGHLVELKFDLKAFTRTLLDSQVYRLSTQVNDSNELDEQNYSHAAWKPVPAEVLLDAVSQATGVAEQFNGWPKGYRAIQVWDNKLPSHFLEVFGRPRRLSVCACERGTEPSMAQALHLMNSPETIGKIQDRSGHAARLAASGLTNDEIVDELYLSTLSRFPSDQERQLLRAAFEESNNRRETVEDVLWTLLNTREFVFNH